MKNYCLPIVAFLFCQFYYSQVTKNQAEYTKNLKTELTRFESNDRVLGNKYLNEKIDIILKTVVFNNSDITTNGSSVSIIQGKDKTSLTASIVNPLTAVGSWQTFIKTGVYAKGKDNIFNFYSDESWKNETGLSVGFIIKAPGSVFYDSKKADGMHQKRILFADSIRTEKLQYFSRQNIKIIQQQKILAKIIELRTEWLKNDIDDKELSYEKIESTLKKEINNDPNIVECSKLINCSETTGCPDNLDCKTPPNYSELIKHIKKKGLLKVKDSIDKIYKKYNALEGMKEGDVAKKVKNELYEFDKKNDVTKGYRLHWFEISGSIGNSSLNIPNDSILTTTELATRNLKKMENNLKASAGASYNFAHNEEYIIFGQFGIKANTGDYLDSNLFQGKPQLKLVEEEYLLYNEDDESLGVYRNLDKSFSTADLNGYLSIFFTKKKNIGFFLNAKHNALIKRPENTYFKNNYSAIAGPLFRQVDKDNNTKAVFGIEVGYENAPYDLKAKEFFIARAKVGIPFNIYNKASKK